MLRRAGSSLAAPEHTGQRAQSDGSSQAALGVLPKREPYEELLGITTNYYDFTMILSGFYSVLKLLRAS